MSVKISPADSVVVVEPDVVAAAAADVRSSGVGKKPQPYHY